MGGECPFPSEAKLGCKGGMGCLWGSGDRVGTEGETGLGALDVPVGFSGSEEKSERSF